MNFSVFYYEIKNETTTAIKTAKKAFDDAIQELEHLDDEEQIDSATIMQLLRDNITLWTKESGEVTVSSIYSYFRMKKERESKIVCVGNFIHL